MSPAGRSIASCLAVLAAALLMLGCGSRGDVTGADIDPQDASDLTGQLDKIQAFFKAHNCDRADKAVGNLRKAINLTSGRTGEQFTANALELTDNLQTRVEDQCQPPPETTTSSSTEIPDTDFETTPTTTEESTTETTTETTTTKSTTTTSTSTTTTPPPTSPPGNPGGGNPGGGPGGGVVPGSSKGKGHPAGQGSRDHGGGGTGERSR